MEWGVWSSRSQIGVLVGSEYQFFYEFQLRSVSTLDSDYIIEFVVKYYFSQNQMELNLLDRVELEGNSEKNAILTINNS